MSHFHTKRIFKTRYLEVLSLWPKFLDGVLLSCGLRDRGDLPETTLYFCRRNYVKLEAIVR